MTLTSIWRNFFKRNELEGDLDAELKAYLDQLTEEKVAKGMAQEEARREARIEIGGMEQVKEQVREARSTASLDTLYQDIKYGARVLRKNPGFSLVAIITLALGIGANTAIFSIVYGVLLRPLPYPNANQLVRISTNWTGAVDGGVSGPEYLDYKKQATSLQNAGMHTPVITMNVAFGAGEPERVPRVMLNSSMFQVLQVPAFLGRTFTAEEDVIGHHRVLVLSYGLWQRRFGNNRNVIGKVVDVAGRPFTIVGVMPPGFAFPSREAGIYHPFNYNLEERPRGARNLRVVARAKPGVPVARVQMEIDTIARRLESKYPDAYPKGSGFAPHVYSLREYMVGSLRAPLFVLFAAVGFVLLIACANVANLILARAGARRKELAIRAALGAGRKRLLRQALTESILLSLIGGALAMLFAYGGLRLLIASSPGNIPRLADVGIESGVFAFTLLISLLTGLGVGCAAAWAFYRVDANSALKEGGRDSHSAGSKKLRGTLVVAEVALAAALLLGAGLLVRAFLKLQQVDPGVRPKGVLTATLSLLHIKYLEQDTQVRFFDQLIEKIAERPSVQSVGAVGNAPFSGWYDDRDFEVEGRPPAAPGLYPFEETRWCTPAYFQTMGIPLLRGRDFEKTDRGAAPPVVIVSDLFARKYFRNQDPIGKRIRVVPEENEVWSTIVGIVGDVRHGGLTNELRPILYIPSAQNPDNTLTLVVRSNEDPMSLAAGLRSTLRQMDPILPFYEVRTMETAISESLAQPRFTFRLISLFALLALVLASVGIYGTLAYSIVQRTSEIGVRMALGASRPMILGMVCHDGLRLVGFGLLIGVAAGAVISRLLTSLLFGLSRYDPAAYGGVAVLTVVVAITAVLIPAHRATRINPIAALRYE